MRFVHAPALALGLALSVCGLTACDLERGPAVTPPLDAAPHGETDARGDSPSAAYLRFVQAVARADSLEGLGPLLADQVRAHVLRLSPKTQSDRLASAKAATPAQITVTREDAEGDLAMLRLAGLRAGKVVRGKATLIREENRWRVRTEAWEP